MCGVRGPKPRPFRPPPAPHEPPDRPPFLGPLAVLLGVFRLTGLTNLDLRDNAITSLPSEIGALTVLVDLLLGENLITSVPSELAALTGLEVLELDFNQLTGVPAEFRDVNPSTYCYLANNPGFSCANVGSGTSCCTADNCPAGTSTCYSG